MERRRLTEPVRCTIPRGSVHRRRMEINKKEVWVSDTVYSITLLGLEETGDELDYQWQYR